MRRSVVCVPEGGWPLLLKSRPALRRGFERFSANHPQQIRPHMCEWECAGAPRASGGAATTGGCSRVAGHRSGSRCWPLRRSCHRRGLAGLVARRSRLGVRLQRRALRRAKRKTARASGRSRAGQQRFVSAADGPQPSAPRPGLCRLGRALCGRCGRPFAAIAAERHTPLGMWPAAASGRTQ